MNNWTSSARTRLEEYFARVRSELQATGADVEEVTDDLRRHVEQEAASLKLAVVTEQDIGNILGRIGACGPESRGARPGSLPAPPRDREASEGGPLVKRPGRAMLFFAVVLPFGTILFEFLTGICAGVLFDPLPNFGHVLLALTVPATNLWLWLALRGHAPVRVAVMGWLSGVSIGIATVYSLAFLPVSPFGIFGILIYGLGLVPLAPYFALVFTAVLQARLASSLKRLFMPWLWAGIGAGVAALVLVTTPLLLTRSGMQMMLSDEASTRARGLALLRVCGLEEDMLRACYGRVGMSGELYAYGKPVGPETARRIYYQVRGHAFNTVPPPKLYAGRARWDLLEQEFTWDRDQGGDQVAGRVKGLSLIASRQDVIVEPNAALAYIEWTIEFKNESVRQREARAQMLLPPGAVVSRLTLWIDGEEREAAFGGRTQVKQAYKEVVTARRDPVLVTTCGPDRVMVQCFPVPPRGGLMKARLGITAPLALLETQQGALRLPSFLERNFSVHKSLQHSVWLDSPQPARAPGTRLAADSSKPGLHSLRGTLSDSELAAPSCVITVERKSEVRNAWTRDTRGEEGFLVRQHMVEERAEAPGAVVLVIDGTEGMGEYYAGVAEALVSLPAGLPFSVLMASDGVRELSGSLRAMDTNGLREVASRVRRGAARGGHDNVPALVRAWDLASAHRNGTVIWLHGPQPEDFGTCDELRQRFARRAGTVRLISVQTRPGPNRVLEKLDGVAGVETLVRTGEVRRELERLLSSFAAGRSKMAFVRERVPSTQAAGDNGVEASPHLARLWALGECLRLYWSRDEEAAMRLATVYQLVTPVSGAVVLETQEQYARAGLQPVPVSSVPMVPEPSVAALLLLALGLLRVRRAWANRRT